MHSRRSTITIGPLLILQALLSLTTALALSAPSSPQQPPPPTPSTTPFPLIIWHGLGDNFEASGLKSTASLAATANPGTPVYLIRLSNTSSLDQRATFFGNVSTQLSTVCAAIAAHPLLSRAPALNALGFSQGGQFLRGYIERCNTPPVRALVTFGSQHNGISRFQKCKAGDWLCRSFQGLLAANTWSQFSQSSLVPAQYYRDAADLESYMEYSNYLASINNERPGERNATYARNIAALEKFVMYVFDADTTVVPKESGWFADVNITSGNVTHLRDRALYKEDWLGLKALDEKGGLVMESIPGEHMQLSEELLKKTFKEYFAPVPAEVSKDDDQDERFALYEDMPPLTTAAEAQSVLQRFDPVWIDL